MSTKSIKGGKNLDKEDGGASSSQKSIAKFDESIASGTSKKSGSIKVRVSNSQKADHLDGVKTPSPRKRRAVDSPKLSGSPSASHYPKRTSRSKAEKKDSIEPSEYEVKAVVGKRVNSHKKVEYQVKWAGYRELSWEPLKNLHCAHLIQAYEDNLKNSAGKRSSKTSPAAKRKSIHRSAKSSPKALATRTFALPAKKRSRSSARRTSAHKKSNQLSLMEKTAEEIFGALVAKNLALLSEGSSSAAQVKIMEILNQAKDAE